MTPVTLGRQDRILGTIPPDSRVIVVPSFLVPWTAKIPPAAVEPGGPPQPRRRADGDLKSMLAFNVPV